MNKTIIFCGRKYKNPLVLASGILGISGKYMAELSQRGAGGVTSKSIWQKEHSGHKNPIIIAENSYLMNAVGLPDAGIEKAREEIKIYKASSSAPFIANVAGGSIEEFVDSAVLVDELGVDLIEVNISCPNVKDEFGNLFSAGMEMATTITRKVKKKVKTPISIKLSPNVNNIAEIAKAVESEGADAITAINTVGPGLRLDIYARQPILKNAFGGLSGPAIFPIAVAKVWEIYRAVKIPIIGTGGITTGQDAIEMMMAGASLLGVGSAFHYRGNDALALINQEIDEFCMKEGIQDLNDIIGVAHK